MSDFEVFVPTLPPQVLSANKIAEGMTGRAARGAISSARQELKTDTIHMVQSRYAPADIPSIPKGVNVIIGFTLVHSFKHPGDDLYRPKDPSNLGGHIAKGPIDALVDLGIIEDDKSVAAGGVVDAVVLRIERCDTLQEEGFLLYVQRTEVRAVTVSV